MSPALIETIFVALDLAGLALLIGISATWLWLSPARAEIPAAASPGLGWPFGIALATLAATGTFDLLVRTAALADVGLSEAWPYIPRILTDTDYGRLWIMRITVLAILALLWFWRRDPPLAGARGAAACGAVLIAFFVSATGHAGDDGNFSVGSLVNSLHITAGCLWGGTVVVYAFAVLPRLRGGKLPSAHIADTAGRLSTLAGAALALVVLTGLYNAWILVGSIPALWTTDYGRVLMVKLLFVASMMGVGAFNRFIAVPAVQAWARPPQLSPMADAPVHRFLNLLRTDTVIFTIILLCAATLGNSVPSTHV